MFFFRLGSTRLTSFRPSSGGISTLEMFSIANDAVAALAESGVTVKRMIVGTVMVSCICHYTYILRPPALTSVPALSHPVDLPQLARLFAHNTTPPTKRRQVLA